MDERVKERSVVQIGVHAPVNQLLRGRLAIVDEVKGWGCIVDVPAVEPENASFPCRVEWQHLAYVGELTW